MKHVLPILLLLLLTACGRHGEVSRTLSRADSLINVAPDSAVALLERMDVEGMRRSDRMLHDLLWGKAMTRAGNLLTDDSLGLALVKYFDRWYRPANQRMMAHYVLGMAYRDMGSAPRALEHFQRAAVVADTTSADCDLPALMRVHSQMALVFKNQYLSNLEAEESRIAAALCWKMGDTLSALILEEKICDRLRMDGRYTECLEATEELYNKFMSAGYPDNANLTCINAVRSALQLEDYLTAKKYLDIYERSTLLTTNPREILGGLTPYYNTKGAYYLAINELDSAELYFRKGLSCYVSTSLESAYDLHYWGLSQIYIQKHETDSITKYLQLYADAHFNSIKQDNSETIIQMKHLYDYGVEQKIAKEEEKKSAQMRNVIVVLMVVMLAGAFLLLYVLYQKLRKERLYSHLRMQYLQLQNELMIANEQLTSLQKQKERIEESLAEKDMQTESMLKTQMEENEKEQNILYARIEALQETLAEWEHTQHPNRLHIGFSSDMALSVHSMESYENSKNQLYNVATDSRKRDQTTAAWQEFIAESEKAFPITTSLLKKTHDLSHDEYRVSLLVLAEFKPRIIEVIMDRASGYATNVRKRLLEKVFGKKGKAEDFDARIMNFRYKNESRQFPAGS